MRSFVYLSDVSCIPEPVMEQLQSYPIELLVLDALFRRKNPSHFSLEESLEAVRRIRPKRTLLVGMSCGMVGGAPTRPMRARSARA